MNFARLFGWTRYKAGSSLLGNWNCVLSSKMENNPYDFDIQTRRKILETEDNGNPAPAQNMAQESGVRRKGRAAQKTTTWHRLNWPRSSGGSIPFPFHRGRVKDDRLFDGDYSSRHRAFLPPPPLLLLLRKKRLDQAPRLCMMHGKNGIEPGYKLNWRTHGAEERKRNAGGIRYKQHTCIDAENSIYHHPYLILWNRE